MYYAHFVGTGQGCDYTIACNEALIKIEASSIDEAVDKVGAMFDVGVYSPEEILSVTIFETVKEFNLNMELILQADREREQRICEDEEKAEYERLKRNSKIRCCYCGQYLKVGAIGIDTIFIPDTHFTVEKILYYHIKCK